MFGLSEIYLDLTKCYHNLPMYVVYVFKLCIIFSARINENVDEGSMDQDNITFDDYDDSDDDIDDVSSSVYILKNCPCSTHYTVFFHLRKS